MTAFISYSHDDRALARRVSGTLTRFGLDHWWDEHIELSSDWNDDLVARLSEATSIVVLWTAASTGSEWVRREARFGVQHSKLIQLVVHDARLPDEFSRLQAAEIPVWEDNTLPRGVRKALNKVAEFQCRSVVVDEHARLLGLRLSGDKVQRYIDEKKHREGYFPKLDGPLFKDVWEMLVHGPIKLYDELHGGSRQGLDEERYYELIEYLAEDV